MRPNSPSRLLWTLGLMFLGGCVFPVREQVDLAVLDLAARPVDIAPMPPADQNAPPSMQQEQKNKTTDGQSSAKSVPAPIFHETKKNPSTLEKENVNAPVKEKPIAPASWQAVNKPEDPANKLKSPPRPLAERLKIPPELPGADAPPLRLPPPDRPKEREAAIERLYPSLPPLGPELPLVPGPDGRPLALADLQRLALSNSPLIRQAAAEVEAAQGAAIQAGLYPNPNFGFEGDTMGTAGGTGLIGAFIEQTIKTGGKLKLATAAAAMDVLNAQIALRRTQTELTKQVRAGYFFVLVARENVRISRALARFTDEVYRIQVEQLKGGQAAAYEPMQLRVLAMQARGNLIQAQNRYTAAWKQLAATLGLPDMPPAELSGKVDMPIPRFHYDSVLAQMMAGHTDIQAAENEIRKARYNLRLAQVAPIPDVNLRVMVQKDYTAPPFEMSPSVVVGVPVPVWDRNQGNIIQSQGTLVRSIEDSRRVRNDLAGQLAGAFERYENNRILLDYYRTYILPDQVRAYQGVYLRHQQEPDAVGFGDVVNAQQVLAATITSYVTTLGAQWEAVVDIANLLQTDNLFLGDEKEEDVQCVAPVPNLEQMLQGRGTRGEGRGARGER